MTWRNRWRRKIQPLGETTLRGMMELDRRKTMMCRILALLQKINLACLRWREAREDEASEEVDEDEEEEEEEAEDQVWLKTQGRAPP